MMIPTSYDEAVALFGAAMKQTLDIEELRAWLAADCADALFGGNHNGPTEKL